MSKEEKVGVWEFYDWDDSLYQVYDFTMDTLLYAKVYQEKPFVFTVFNGQDSVKDTIDFPPVLIGGEQFYREILWRNLVYPPLAVEDNISGTVLIAFVIDTTGEVDYFQIIKGIREDINTEVERVMELLAEYQWVPAIKNNMKLKCQVIVPCTFKLN